MVTGADLYWVTRMDGLRDTVFGLGLAATILAPVVIVGLLGTWFCIWDSNTRPRFTEGMKMARESLADFRSKLFGRMLWAIPTLVLGVALLVGNVFIPTTKEYAAIKVVPLVLNSERVEKVAEDAGELYDLAVMWAKESLKNGGE